MDWKGERSGRCRQSAPDTPEAPNIQYSNNQSPSWTHCTSEAGVGADARLTKNDKAPIAEVDQPRGAGTVFVGSSRPVVGTGEGRLTMEEIIFSLKHYWRFVDCEALELKALSQGVGEKAA